MKMILGLDIGGAHLKMAHTDGTARTVPFELWKQPTKLPAALRELAASAPAFDEIAVTMTGELCDCFETKREGVQAIVDAVESTFLPKSLWIWRNDGRFVDLAAARTDPLPAASANWLALATFAGRFVRRGSALLIDAGSTTTDIVPLRDGVPSPVGRTDLERLVSKELVYQGVRRTPVCAVLGSQVCAELFATTLDAYLLTGQVDEAPDSCQTADGRPATKQCAHARLARMLGADATTMALKGALRLAHKVGQQQLKTLVSAITKVQGYVAGPINTVVVAGSGEFLAHVAALKMPWSAAPAILSLRNQLGEAVSTAACAYAVAVLAAERADGP